jgi:hypothetical protein
MKYREVLLNVCSSIADIAGFVWTSDPLRFFASPIHIEKFPCKLYYLASFQIPYQVYHLVH